jgi:hypothetical protein
MKLFALIALVTIRASAAEQCAATCSDVDGEETLTFQVSELEIAATNAGTMKTKNSIEMHREGLKRTKDLWSNQKRNLAGEYAKELRKLNDEMDSTYGTFMDNHEDIAAADQAERQRMRALKAASEECQKKWWSGAARHRNLGGVGRTACGRRKRGQRRRSGPIGCCRKVGRRGGVEHCMRLRKISHVRHRNDHRS